MATYSEQLAAVEAAIADILAGRLQSYTFAGRTVDKLGIEVLFKERQRLEPLAKREALTGSTGIRQRGGYLQR